MHVFFSGKIQSDLITDVVMEVNRAEQLTATFTTQPYNHLVQTFASTYDLGRDFVLREDHLDALESIKTQESHNHVAEVVNQIKEDIATLQFNTETSMRDLDKKLKNAISVHTEEMYQQVTQTIRNTKVPVPFNSLEEAEEYLGASQMHKDALCLSFSNTEVALTAKERIGAQLNKRLPAGLILDYLFSPEAKPNLRVRLFGPGVRFFLTDRAKWMMGMTWHDTSEESILYKYSQHLHYSEARVLQKRLERKATLVKKKKK